MDLDLILKCLNRLQEAETFLSAPSRELAAFDLSRAGFNAYNSILDALGLISAAVLDLTDVVRNQHPLAIREMVR
jgi:hypothetical protein